MRTSSIIIAVVVVVVIAVGIALLAPYAGSQTNPYFKPILNLAGINGSGQLMETIQNGVSNHSEFNLTYSATAKTTSAVYPVEYTAKLSIDRNGNIIALSLLTENPEILFGQVGASGTYYSTSEYNGSGFLSCASDRAACGYERAAQNGSFAAEISSALSNLFSPAFFTAPYLALMNGNRSQGGSNDFILTYSNTQVYDGEQCAYMGVASTQNFIASSGLKVSGDVCFSEALGLPVYGDVTTTYDGVDISVSFSSVLTGEKS